MAADPDWMLRAAAFEAVRRMVKEHGQVVPWDAIEGGFEHRGRRLCLASRAVGIFRPKEFQHAALRHPTSP